MPREPGGEGAVTDFRASGKLMLYVLSWDWIPALL